MELSYLIMKRIIILFLLPALLIATSGLAGVHRASSAAMHLDAEPPLVGLTSVPEGQTFVEGDTLHFAWWASDAHPAPHDSSRVAAVLVRGQVRDTLRWSAETEPVWTWIAPDVSSADNVLRVTVRDEFGNTTTDVSDVFRLLRSDTSIVDLPPAPHLQAPTPNPFNPSTRIAFTLPEPAIVNLSVYDLLGRHVRRLHHGPLNLGTHARTWDGRDDAGRRVAGGPYLIRLEAQGLEPDTRKVVLLP